MYLLLDGIDQYLSISRAVTGSGQAHQPWSRHEVRPHSMSLRSSSDPGPLTFHPSASPESTPHSAKPIRRSPALNRLTASGHSSWHGSKSSPASTRSAPTHASNKCWSRYLFPIERPNRETSPTHFRAGNCYIKLDLQAEMVPKKGRIAELDKSLPCNVIAHSAKVYWKARR